MGATAFSAATDADLAVRSRVSRLPMAATPMTAARTPSAPASSGWACTTSPRPLSRCATAPVR
ncbi:hypothetical protein ACFQX7_19595 [Luedemannella flava]